MFILIICKFQYTSANYLHHIAGKIILEKISSEISIFYNFLPPV